MTGKKSTGQSTQATWALGLVVTLGALATSAPAMANTPCRDPWVSQAVTEVTGRAPQGQGDAGECDYRRYGGGQWNSYPDLLGKVRSALGARPAGSIASQLKQAPAGPLIKPGTGPGVSGKGDVGVTSNSSGNIVSNHSSGMAGAQGNK